MESLNKRKMMLAISVSLAAYAFAIAGCGKKVDDSDTSAVARVAAMKNLQGSWISNSDPSKSVYSLKIVTNLITLKKICATDKETFIAKVDQKYVADSKVINFAGPLTNKDKASCTLEIPAGEVKYSVKGDDLIIAVGPEAEAKAKADKEATDKTKITDEIVGLKFTRSTDEKLAALEDASQNRPTLPGATTDVKKAPATPAEQALIDAAALQFASIKGKWVAENDDEAVKKATKDLTKHDYSLIDFIDPTSFAASQACYYERSADQVALGEIKAVGIKINRTNTSASNTTNETAKYNFVDATSFQITRGYNRGMVAVQPGQISLKDTAVTDCKMFYPEGLIRYEVSGDNLKLTFPKVNKDDKDEKEEVRTFHKPKSAADIIILNKIKDIVPKAEASVEKALEKSDKPDLSDKNEQKFEAAPAAKETAPASGTGAAPAAKVEAPATLPSAPIDAGIGNAGQPAPDAAPNTVKVAAPAEAKAAAPAEAKAAAPAAVKAAALAEVKKEKQSSKKVVVVPVSIIPEKKLVAKPAAVNNAPVAPVKAATATPPSKGFMEIVSDFFTVGASKDNESDTLVGFGND